MECKQTHMLASKPYTLFHLYVCALKHELIPLCFHMFSESKFILVCISTEYIILLDLNNSYVIIVIPKYFSVRNVSRYNSKIEIRHVYVPRFVKFPCTWAVYAHFSSC